MNRSLKCLLTATGWRQRSKAAVALMCFAASAFIPVHAALGGSAASVQSDAVKLQGRMESTSHTMFTTAVVSLPSGTVVNEYISPAGSVFALSWHGLRPPDLSQLLGHYYADYQAAVARQSHVRHHHILINTNGMVFEAHGHMRNMRGSVYLPALMPAGLSLGNLH